MAESAEEVTDSVVVKGAKVFFVLLNNFSGNSCC
jgi:hypothetical protein